MAKIICFFKDESDIKDKPRIFFTCHPDDFNTCFKTISEDLFKNHDCVIYYTENMNDSFSDTERETDLCRMNLFVVPITAKLLTESNRAMDEDVPYAMSKFIPILPIIMESGLEELYSSPDKFYQLQYLNPYSNDPTEISYTDKLKRFLDEVLINDELIKRVRTAFKTYIFLSYRKKDRQYANKFMQLVHNDPSMLSVAIWFDEFLTPGEDFKDNIEKALKKCDLFALLVTPNILEEPGGKPNFVISDEYPMALRFGIDIFPVEMEETNKIELASKFAGIPSCIDANDIEKFNNCLIKALPKTAFNNDSNDVAQYFLLGIAYLEGIDVETNREKAVVIIEECADKDYEDAIRSMVSIYTNGKGVPKSYIQAQKWFKKLIELKERDLTSLSGKISLMEVYDEYCDFLSRYFILEYSRFVNTTMLPKAKGFAASCRLPDTNSGDLFYWLCRSYYRSVHADMSRDADNHNAEYYRFLIESNMGFVTDPEQISSIKEFLDYLKDAAEFWGEMSKYLNSKETETEEIKEAPSIESLLQKLSACEKEYSSAPSDNALFNLIGAYEPIIKYYKEVNGFSNLYKYTTMQLSYKEKQYYSNPDILEGADILYIYEETVSLLVKQGMLREAIQALINEINFLEYVISIGEDLYQEEYICVLESLLELYTEIGDEANAREILLKIKKINSDNG